MQINFGGYNDKTNANKHHHRYISYQQSVDHKNELLVE